MEIMVDLAGGLFWLLLTSWRDPEPRMSQPSATTERNAEPDGSCAGRREGALAASMLDLREGGRDMLLRLAPATNG